MAGQSAGQAASSGVDTGGAGGGEDIDVNELVRDFETRHGQTSQQLQATQERLQKTDGKLEQTAATLERVKAALTGATDKETAAADPADAVIAHYETQMENLINAALAAEKQGRPIPVTVQIGLNSMQGLIDQAKQNKELRAQVMRLSQGVQRATDPDLRINDDAYRVMEGYLGNALDSVYGVNREDPSLNQLKGVQFTAVSKLITGEIEDLQKTDPATWDQIRRSPAKMKGMVQHFVKQVIPQRARELMYEDEVRRTELSADDLKVAWLESKRIPDPEERRAVQAKLRPQLLAAMVPQRGRARQSQGRAGMSINDLY
jgi:hypothetical protein